MAVTKKPKLKFHKEQAGDIESIRDELKGNYGNMLWIGPNKSRVFRILVEPKEFLKYHFVRNEALGVKGKLPTFEGYEEYVDGSPRVDLGHVFPVATIDTETGDIDKVMWYEPPKGILGDMLKHYEKRKTITDRDFEVSREGSGQKGTKYTLLNDDPEERPEADDLEIPDFDDELERMVNEYIRALNTSSKTAAKDSDDDAPARSSRRRVMEEPEEEPEPPKKKRAKKPEPEEEGEEPEPVKKAPAKKKKAEPEPEPEEEPDDDAPGGNDDEVTDTFTVDSTDAEVSYTGTLTGSDGTEYEDVYFDRSHHDLSEVKVGGQYKLTLEQDADGDWLVTSAVAAVKKTRAKK